MTLKVAVLMDLPENQAYFVATMAALEHAATAAGVDSRPAVVRTDALSTVAGWDAVVVGPGSPYREPEAVLEAIRGAREQGIPLAGT